MHTFIRPMRDMLQPHNDTVIVDWMDFCSDLADGISSNYENTLEDVLRSLWYVKNNFDEEVLQKSLRLYVLPSEIVNGAMRFQEGLTMEEVQKLADDGYLQGGYVPNRNYGVNGYPSEEEQAEEETNEIIAAEDLVEQAVYAANAPNCCTESEQAENMLAMLGANIVDEDVYHDEDECPSLNMGGVT